MDEHALTILVAAFELLILAVVARAYQDEALRGIERGHARLLDRAELMFRACAATMALTGVAIGLLLWFRSTELVRFCKAMVTLVLAGLVAMCLAYAFGCYLIPWKEAGADRAGEEVRPEGRDEAGHHGS